MTNSYISGDEFFAAIKTSAIFLTNGTVVLYSNMQKRFAHDIAIRSNKVFQRQGPGGRSSNEGTFLDSKGFLTVRPGVIATVFGATGMLGRSLVNSLGEFILSCFIVHQSPSLICYLRVLMKQEMRRQNVL